MLTPLLDFVSVAFVHFEGITEPFDDCHDMITAATLIPFLNFFAFRCFFIPLLHALQPRLFSDCMYDQRARRHNMPAKPEMKSKIYIDPKIAFGKKDK